MTLEMSRCFLTVLIFTAVSPAWGAGDDGLYEVGVAKVDITPDYPVRLAGYAVRKTESEGVAQHIYAKAIAVGGDSDEPALLITVDNCGVPWEVRAEVISRLQPKTRLVPDRVTICSTHTHSAPLLTGYLRNLFGAPLPAEQAARVQHYTHDLTTWLEAAALEALKNRRPARLSFGISQADFAANRRTKGGPVDHDLPILMVTDPDGKLRAILAAYACHCTTLTGEFNQINGDWAGYAQADLEQNHPGVIALIAIGCGGDANPNPRPGFELAKQHGAAIAKAVDQVCGKSGAPVAGQLVCRTKSIDLPFDTLPTLAEWKSRGLQTNYIGGHARLNLARLERGEKLPTTQPYLVQSWVFGKSLAMVFLPGEVVVDYSLRLKREYDAKRLWVNAYANDVPCYIPSERVLKEGGYEGGDAMVYYDRPTRFAPGIEGRIIDAVHKVLPAGEFE